MARSTSDKYDYVIIDPVSPEAVRSSFCWLQYLLYSSLKERGVRVKIIEGFDIKNDSLPEADNIIISLWSYPQIEACLELKMIYPRALYIGYDPLIDSFGLSKYPVTYPEIQKGMRSCVKYYSDFKEILLSDSDMHVKKYKGSAWPLFTTYGCVNHCLFCPVAANCQGERVEISLIDTYNLLDMCEEKGYKNIHFADEDFFYDINRAYKILKYTEGKGFQYIALGTAGKVLEFIEEFGAHTLFDTGMKVIEVGLESASKKLNTSMGKVAKGGKNRYETLAEKAKGFVDIFWLTMTFFPGETVQSLKETGDFLSKYGYNYGELYQRIQTNSSIGGLGQFFLPYVGTAAIPLAAVGLIFPENQFSRLEPNIIPLSFLGSKIKKIRTVDRKERKWFELYNLDLINYHRIVKSKEKIQTVKDLYVLLRKEGMTPKEAGIMLAICARLGVIE